MEGGEVTPDHKKTIECPREECKKISVLEDLTIKMGGLLCPKCRIIMVWPGDPVFKKEMLRRREESE